MSDAQSAELRLEELRNDLNKLETEGNKDSKEYRDLEQQYSQLQDEVR